MSEEKKSKTFFELLFHGHIEQMELHHGKEKCLEYVNEASALFKDMQYMFVLSVLLCICLLADFSVISANSLVYLILLTLYLLFLAFRSFVRLKNLRALTFGDVPLLMKWIRVVSVLAVFSLLSAGYFSYYAFNILKFYLSDGQTVEMDTVGMNVRIPINYEGLQWGDPKWSSQPGPEDIRPEYAFSVSNEFQTMYFHVSADLRKQNLSIDRFKDAFDDASRMALDSLVTRGPEIIQIDDREVHKTVGYRKNYPRHTYIYYRMIHKGAVILYTYRFQTAKCNAEKEFRFADEMLGNIELYEPVISEALRKKIDEKRKPAVDKRPSDYTVDEHGLEIRSACMKFSFPEGAGPLNWNTCSRSKYDFDMKVGRSDANFKLQVVWTSEKAPLTEFKDEFFFWAERILDKRIIKEQSLNRYGAKSAYRAVGTATSDPDHVIAMYQMHHKGARLRVVVRIPASESSYENELDKVESMISDIVFY